MNIEISTILSLATTIPVVSKSKKQIGLLSFNSILKIYAHKYKILKLPFIDILIKIYDLAIKKPFRKRKGLIYNYLNRKLFRRIKFINQKIHFFMEVFKEMIGCFDDDFKSIVVNIYF